MNSPFDRMTHEPYPPRRDDEKRLAAQIDLVQHKLDMVFAKLLLIENLLHRSPP